MAPEITYFTDDTIERRRQELLDEVGMTFEELDERAKAYLLDSETAAVYRDLQDLDYLQAKTA